MAYLGAGLSRFNTADKLTVTGTAEFNSTITATTDDNNPQLIIKSTDADADVGPEMELLRDSASPANSDVLGQIQYKGKNDAAETIAYAEIDAVISDVADGTEDGELRLQVKRAGTTRTGLSLGPTETVFNDAGIDNDFRIESDGNTSMFFLDAGNNVIGIGTGSPTNPLTVRGDGGTGTSAAIRWRDESDQGATFGVFNSGNVVFNAEQGNLFLNFGGTGKFTFESGGDLDINDGNLKLASGHGIDFSATSDTGGMSSELLSDYEEGSFTPTCEDSSGNTATTAESTGYYRKIGGLVHVELRMTNINKSSLTSTDDVRVAGLPFTHSSRAGAAQGIISGIYHNHINLDHTGVLMGILGEGNSHFLIVELRDTAGDHDILVSDLSASNTSDLLISFTYHTEQ